MVYLVQVIMCTNKQNTHLMTPDRGGIKFPNGHILVNERWQRETLSREISKKVKVAFSDALGFIDFYLTEKRPVVYFSESDLKANKKECKEKISKLNTVSNGMGIVIVMWNSRLVSDFSDIQEYAALDHDLLVLPISCQTELPVVLYKLVMQEIKSPQKDRGSKLGLSSDEQLSILNKIPGIELKEAKQLLQRFGNIISISDASEDELTSTIGKRIARHVRDFFNQPIT